MENKAINNWQQIWKSRTLENSKASTLENLIALDGFDSPLGLMKERDWRNYLDVLTLRSNIVEGDSIFEIGCGAGAFLYPFYELGYEVSGIDYSDNLIYIAKKTMPKRDIYFENIDAAECKINPPYTIVAANHVIHYFPSITFASNVLDIMLSKASRTVLLLGIPDLKWKFESEQMRRGLLSHDEYEKKYINLDILYFEKDWLEKLAVDRGFKTLFFNHEMPGFAQNAFRFDCLMTKDNSILK